MTNHLRKLIFLCPNDFFNERKNDRFLEIKKNLDVFTNTFRLLSRAMDRELELENADLKEQLMSSKEKGAEEADMFNQREVKPFLAFYRKECISVNHQTGIYQ